MSVVDSAKTRVTASEMSLDSSVLMTACASTCTFSDADYETSSEIHSPREAVADKQLSRCSSTAEPEPEFTYVLASRSSTILVDKARESVLSFNSSRFGSGI